MTGSQPHRVLGTIRTLTVGSLAAAALGAGVVTVHLAGDRTTATASPRTQTGTSDDSGNAGGAVPAAPAPADPTPADPAPAAPRAHTKNFGAVPPVQPGSGQAQSGTHGS